MDAPVIIADGLRGKNAVEVPVENLQYFKKTFIAREIYEANSMVVLSHFKGHLVAGFGGAIKNLAMGCASFWGKRDQHDTKSTGKSGKLHCLRLLHENLPCPCHQHEKRRQYKTRFC